MTSRLLATAGILVVLSVAARYSATPWQEVRVWMPDRPVEELPMQLAGWTGEDVEEGGEQHLAAGAVAGIARRYRDRSGRIASLYVAVHEYLPGRSVALPHPPEICYTGGAGYTVVRTQEVRVTAATQSGGHPRLLTLEREGQVIHVLYWYQMDGAVITTNEALRAKLWSLRGEPAVPPLVKVMLQTSAPDAGTAEGHLAQLAKPVMEWLEQWRTLDARSFAVVEGEDD